ncbi:hypothetical protein EV401DRAFT_1895798 [Pisolithus croceorrhizus]|nr:hypothetical protein EV401DRAFT_1895798 [Pisolithus croceorrhizus]
MWHVEPYLLEVEVEDTGGVQPDEGAGTLKEPDEASQHASNEVEDSEDLPKLSSEALETQGDLTFTTSKCAETQTGHRKPKNEVCMDNEAGESRDLPEMSCKALDPVDSIAGQTGGHPTEHVPQMPIKEDQHSWTNSKTVTNVPDPPCTHTKFPTMQIECPTLWNESRTVGTGLEGPNHASKGEYYIYKGQFTWDTPPDEVQEMGVVGSPRDDRGDSAMVMLAKLEIKAISANMEPDKAEDTGGGGDDTASKVFIDSHRVKKMLLANSRSQQGEQKTRQQNNIPGPPQTPPNGCMHPPEAIREPC